MGAKHSQSIAQMLQFVDDEEVSINRELTKVPVVQFRQGPNVHQIQSRGNAAAGTVYPINPHIDDRGTVSDAAINVFIPHARHHYIKMTLTNTEPTITFQKLFVGLSSLFTLDLTNGVALSSLTFSPVLSNAPTLNLGNTERNILTIMAHKTATEERYEVISSSGGGAAIPNGTVENEHLEWDNTAGDWLAVQASTYGATGPFADSGFLRFANNQIMLSGRNNADGGNLEFKTTTADAFDMTNSGNGLIAFILRATDAVNPDTLLTIIRGADLAGAGGTLAFNATNTTTWDFSLNGGTYIFFDSSVPVILFEQPLDMQANNIVDFTLLRGTKNAAQQIISDDVTITTHTGWVHTVQIGAVFAFQVNSVDIAVMNSTIMEMSIIIDMNGNNINDIGIATIDNLIFNDSVGGVASATNPTIYYDLSNTELVIQTQSNTEEIVLAAGSAAADKFARMDKTLTEFNLVAGHEFRINALHVFEISQFDGEMTLDVPIPSSTGNPNFKINAVVTDANFGGDLGTSALPWNNLNVEQIRFREGDDITNISSMATRANKLRINVATADTIALQVNGVIEYDFSATAVTFTAGNNIILQGSGAAGFIQIGEITDPAAGTNSGKFYVKDVGGISKPFYIGDGQAAVDLSSAASGGPPFDDNQVIIQDEADNTKTLSFNLSLQSTGAANLLSWAVGGSRTHTFSATTGTVAQLNLAQTWTALQTFDISGRGILMTNRTQIEFEDGATNLELKAGFNLHDPADPTITSREGFEIDLNTGAVGDTEVFQVGDGNNSPWFQVDDDSARFESIVLGSAGGHRIFFAIDDVISSGETIAKLLSQARYNSTVWTEYAEIDFYVDTVSTTLNNNVGGMRLRCKQVAGNNMIDIIDMTGNATSGEIGFYTGTTPIAQQTTLRVAGGASLAVLIAVVQSLQDDLHNTGLVLDA